MGMVLGIGGASVYGFERGQIPFIAGELLYSGSCAGHNALINKLPRLVNLKDKNRVFSADNKTMFSAGRELAAKNESSGGFGNVRTNGNRASGGQSWNE